MLLRLLLLAAASAAGGGSSAFQTADSQQYLQLAESLLREGRFEGPTGPELHRTPGYPLLLAACLATGHAQLAALLLQAALGCATAWLVYRLVLDARGDAVAAERCALLCAIEPVQLAWGARIMSETLLTFFVTACAWALAGDLAR